MFGRSSAQIDHAATEQDAARRAVCQVEVLRRHLSDEAERIGRSGSIDLQVGSSLPGQSFRHIVRLRGESTQLGVDLGEIIEAARQTTEISTFGEARKRLIDGGAPGQIKKIPGREDAAASLCADTFQDPVLNGGRVDLGFH